MIAASLGPIDYRDSVLQRLGVISTSIEGRKLHKQRSAETCVSLST